MKLGVSEKETPFENQSSIEPGQFQARDCDSSLSEAQ
jgi:hypothetical protein